MAELFAAGEEFGWGQGVRGMDAATGLQPRDGVAAN